MTLLPLLLMCGLGLAEKDISVSKAEHDANSFLVHTVTSAYQAGTTKIRVLLPKGEPPRGGWRVVYVLPVEAAEESRYGDGLVELKKHDLANALGVVFVAPTFSHLPWYADHPTKPELRQESYLVKVVVPFVEKTYPVRAGREGRLLLGFSKSGWGAFVLLLRNPDVFARAGAWDAPLMLDKPGRYGSAEIFGDQANFERHQFSKLVKEKAALFAREPRLILHGYGNFRKEHEEAHTLMDQLGVKHAYRGDPPIKHDWHSGWVKGLVEVLVATK